MATYGYDDKSYNPPAPAAEFEVTVDIAKIIGKSNYVPEKVKMIIDSGADISMVPNSIIKELEKKIGKLPYGKFEVEDFYGKRSKHKSYDLTISLQANEANDERKLTFLGIDDIEGILGRDLLNKYLIKLDGPNLTWTVLTKEK